MITNHLAKQKESPHNTLQYGLIVATRLKEQAWQRMPLPHAIPVSLFSSSHAGSSGILPVFVGSVRLPPATMPSALVLVNYY